MRNVLAVSWIAGLALIGVSCTTVGQSSSGSGSPSAHVVGTPDDAASAGLAPENNRSGSPSPVGTPDSPPDTIGDVDRALPSIPFRKKPPVEGGAPAVLGDGVRVRLSSADPVVVVGKGPGEISGPGIAFTLKISNRSPEAIDSQLVVVAAEMADGSPLAGTQSTPTVPFSGLIRPGETDSATYAFLLEGASRSGVRLTVTYAPLATVVTIIPEP